MNNHRSIPRKIFITADYFLLALFGAVCLIPFLHILAVSFSARIPATAGEVFVWPIGFNLDSYTRLLREQDFLTSLLVTAERIALGVSINFILTVTIAYPLSKEPGSFRHRTFFAWFFVITMLVSGGLIPWYLTVKTLGLTDTIWALVLPGAVPVFNVVLLLNFFRGLPKEFEEAAMIDGARHFSILWRIYLPVSIPGLATITLFSFVGHWNSWFDGMILMNHMDRFPLQSYLYMFVIQGTAKLMTESELRLLKNASDQTIKAAFIILGTVPILLLFPFFQSFLKTGLVMGSVKE